MGYNHRIDTSEVPTKLTVPVQGTAGLQVVVGTAPVNLAEDPYGVTSVPVIAYSFTEAQKLLGYSDDFAEYTLCQSMDASFRVFAVAPVVFINVLDPKKHRKDYEKKNVAVVKRKAVTGDKGILLDRLEVKDQSDNALERDTDYLASFNTSGGIDITLLATEKTAGVTALNLAGECLDPDMVTEMDIIGGYDVATGQETGLEVIRQVYPKLGLTPGLILAPGWSSSTAVAAVLCAKTESINGVFTCETVIDMDCGECRVYTGLKEAKEAMAVSSPHAVLVWPKLKLGETVYSFSAVWAAMTAYTDAQNGDIPVESPSNELLNMGATVLEDGTELVLDTSMAELVNSFGIVTAINDSGWKSWGNNTAAYPGTTDPKDRWIACRRMMSWYRNHFILAYKAKVDRRGNYRLIESVVDSENIYLNSLSQDQKIAGGEISFNENANPVTSILGGNIFFDTKLAFFVPAEYIENRIEFDPTILQNALGGA